MEPRAPIWRRVHAFEFNDQPWLPETLRRAETEYLEAMISLLGAFAPLAPLLAELVEEASVPQIVDLCSGGAGPYLHLHREISRAAGRPVPVVLTDLYPNEEAFARAEARSGGALRGQREPVDARAVPPALGGVRTIFDGFHHFRPHEARAILADAAARREPILVAELPARRLATLAAVPLIPLWALLAAPKVRPLRLSHLALTYLMPLLPALLTWDGMVSSLRAYRADEMLALTAGLGDGYRWEANTLRQRGLTITYLVGRPLRR